jgi:hypothetical protein
MVIQFVITRTFLIDGRVIYKRSAWILPRRGPSPYFEMCRAEVHFAAWQVPWLISNASMRLSRTLVAREVADGFQLVYVPALGAPGLTTDDMSPRRVVATLAEIARFHSAFWGPARHSVNSTYRPRFEMDPPLARTLSRASCLWHRVALTGRAIELRIKADPAQSVVHGDLHAGNVVFAPAPVEHDARRIGATLIDFGRVHKHIATRDLAYLFIRVGVDTDEAGELLMLSRYYAYLSVSLRRRGVAAISFDDLRRSYVLAYVQLAAWFRGNTIGMKRGVMGFERSADGGMLRTTRAFIDSLDGGRALASQSAYVEAIFRRMPRPATCPAPSRRA